MKNENYSCITKSTVSRREPSPGERARLRAVGVVQEQREARARREALAIIKRDDQARDAKAFAGTTVIEDLQATRRRPLDAPMATYAADPTERLAWEPRSYALEPQEIPSLGIGRLVLTLLLIIAGYIAGVATGRLL